MIACLLAFGSPSLHAQEKPRWVIVSKEYIGTSTRTLYDSKNNILSTQTQIWPLAGTPQVPKGAYGVNQKASVYSGGTIAFILKWVYPSNNTPAPNPPAEVFVQQDSIAKWMDIGEEPDPIALGSASNGLGHSYVEFIVGGRSQGFKLTRMNGSTGEIYVACNVNVQASLEEPSTTGGELQAFINYDVKTVAPADNYDFNYPAGSNPAGTTPYATTAANYQSKLDGTTGYYTEERFYTNQSAQHALDQLKKTAVFFVFGHGGAIMQSMQTFWTGTKMT